MIFSRVREKVGLWPTKWGSQKYRVLLVQESFICYLRNDFLTCDGEGRWYFDRGPAFAATFDSTSFWLAGGDSRVGKRGRAVSFVGEILLLALFFDGLSLLCFVTKLRRDDVFGLSFDSFIVWVSTVSGLVLWTVFGTSALLGNMSTMDLLVTGWSLLLFKRLIWIPTWDRKKEKKHFLRDVRL